MLNVDVLFTCIPKLAKDFRCGEPFLAPTHPAGQEALPMLSLGHHHSVRLCLARPICTPGTSKSRSRRGTQHFHAFHISPVLQSTLTLGWKKHTTTSSAPSLAPKPGRLELTRSMHHPSTLMPHEVRARVWGGPVPSRQHW